MLLQLDDILTVGFMNLVSLYLSALQFHLDSIHMLKEGQSNVPVLVSN